MAGKRKEEQPDALGQVFDFLFQQAELPPDKRKPIKPTGISGNRELTNALAAALEMPGGVLTNQAISDFNDSLDIAVTLQKTDPLGIGKVKLTVGSTADIIRDPVKYFEKARKTSQGFAKSHRAEAFGRFMRDAVATGWAHKYADIEVRNAVEAAMSADRVLSQKDIDEMTFTMQKAIGVSASGRFDKYAADMGHMAERSAELVGRKMFTESEWNGLSNNQREVVRNSLINLRKIQNEQNTPKSEIKFQAQIKEDFYEAFGKAKGDKYLNQILKSSSVSLFNPGTYRVLEKENLTNRLNKLKAKGLGNLTASERNMISSLEKAIIVIDGHDFSNPNIKISEKVKELRQYGNKIDSELKISGLDSDRKRELRKQKRELNSDIRQLSTLSALGKVAEIEGIYNSMKNYYGAGFLPSVFSGDFFDPNKNKLWNPTETLKLKKYENILGVGTADIEIFVPKKSHNQNKIKDAYSEFGASIYYFTPRALMRTFLYNGEMFTYLMTRADSKMMKYVMEMNPNLKANGVKQLMGDYGDEALKNLLKSYTGKHKKELERAIKQFTNNKKLAKFFGTNARFKNIIAGAFDKRLKSFRTNIARQLLKNKTFKKAFSGASAKLLGQWISEGGVQVFARAIVTAVFNAVGFVTTGGVFNAVITGVTFIATDVIYRFTSLFFALVVFAIFGIFGIGIMISNSFVTKNIEANNTYTKVEPGTVVACENFTGTSPIIDDLYPGGALEEFVAGALPSGVECLLGEASFRCSQGAYGDYSHKSVAANDYPEVDYFHAPTFCNKSKGNCEITYNAAVHCVNGYAGGMIVLKASYEGQTYEFKLIHVDGLYSPGMKVGSGQRIARVMTLEETTNACSTGKHLHLETKLNGSTVDPYDVMTSLSSGGGFGCSISACP